MTKPITERRFDFPCKVMVDDEPCNGTLFNKKSGKCCDCVKRDRIAAVREKCEGRPQLRDAESYMTPGERLSSKVRRELLYMGHPDAERIRYDDAERITM